jgi:hypothetical protein
MPEVGRRLNGSSSEILTGIRESAYCFDHKSLRDKSKNRSHPLRTEEAVFPRKQVRLLSNWHSTSFSDLMRDVSPKG